MAPARTHVPPKVHPVLRAEGLEVQAFTLGPFRENAYLVMEPASRAAVMVDPGSDGDFLVHEIERRELTLSMVLLTHGHFDHLGAAAQLGQHFGVPTYAHDADCALIQHAATYSLRLLGQTTRPTEVVPLSGAARLSWAGNEIEIQAVPGHTLGGVTYGLPGLVFTGDTLLRAQIGPTEYPESDRATLTDSVSRLIGHLPSSASLHPGHGRPWEAEAARLWWAAQPATRAGTDLQTSARIPVDGST
jgi:hydroxyacylglutathione hydrolase